MIGVPEEKRQETEQNKIFEQRMTRNFSYLIEDIYTSKKLNEIQGWTQTIIPEHIIILFYKWEDMSYCKKVFYNFFDFECFKSPSSFFSFSHTNYQTDEEAWGSFLQCQMEIPNTGAPAQLQEPSAWSQRLTSIKPPSKTLYLTLWCHLDCLQKSVPIWTNFGGEDLYWFLWMDTTIVTMSRCLPQPELFVLLLWLLTDWLPYAFNYYAS